MDIDQTIGLIVGRTENVNEDIGGCTTTMPIEMACKIVRSSKNGD